jgi:PHD/YefM family antitoxin component YafN of YafNO toxin-antitoxin module
MIATENTQSMAEFRSAVDATIDRVYQTGETEFITDEGGPRAVLLSPATYAEMARVIQLARDVEVIRRSMAQYRADEGQELHAFSGELRAKVIAMYGAAATDGAE